MVKVILNSEIQIKDRLRQDILEELGVRFIRFNDADIKKNMNSVIHSLQIKIEELESNSV